MKKNVEPFNLFGERAIIWNKEEAKSVLQANSYYLYLIGFIVFGIGVFNYIFYLPSKFSALLPLAYGMLIILLTYITNKFNSRLAVSILLFNFGWVAIEKILNLHEGFNIMGLVMLIVFMAVARSAYSVFKYNSFVSNKK